MQTDSLVPEVAGIFHQADLTFSVHLETQGRVRGEARAGAGVSEYSEVLHYMRGIYFPQGTNKNHK